ncbi:hypothetical protein HA402_006972 [Bradysia odoriphaga]|nr:hypothetical protein HA402_006972 [Bradysia odoriphaga]
MIKLVPIENLIQKEATIVLDKAPIELSDSDNEVLVTRARSKSGDAETSSCKASILKSVFNPVNEIAVHVHVHVNRSAERTRNCTVNLSRTDLTRLVASKGLELMPTLNDASTTKATTTNVLRNDVSSEEKEDCKATKSHRTNGSKSNSKEIAKNLLNLSSSEGEDDCTNDMNDNGDERNVSNSNDMSSASRNVVKKAISLVSSADSDEEIVEPKPTRKVKQRTAVVHSSDSSSDDEKSGKSKTAGKASTKSDSDFKASDSSDSEKIKMNKRKAAKKAKNASDDSDEEYKVEQKPAKKKRRRIKNASDSSDNEKNTSRKKIRKILDEKDLEDETKEAAREEMERKRRIEERQKLYNEYYEEEPEKVKVLDKLVLDFDEKSKEELVSVDRKLVKKLKPHQGSGVKFMWDTCFESISRIDKGKGSGCILAHCMGLGKTLQVVTLVHTLLSHSEKTGVEKVLIICPLSTVLNWVNEFRIWLKECADNKDIEIYEISKYKLIRERINKISEWYNDGGVLIMGYDMYRILSSETSKMKKMKKRDKESISALLVDPGPDMVVCDEGHLLKNSKTSLSKAVNRIRTLRRIVLTGTPLQNNLNEYYCMVQFVKPNLLGKYNEYLNRFVNPITNGQYEDSTPRDIQMMKKRSHILHKLLDGCVQRRDYSVLAPYLPVKHEYVVSIQLTPLQIKLYEYYIKQRPVADTAKPTRSSVLFQDFQNLQRIWTHPRVLRFNSDRYEVKEQRRRAELSEDEESEGSLKDFIADSDTDESEAESTSSSSSSVASDDSRKKGKRKAAKVPVKRRTRANKDEFEDPVEPLELPQVKIENPTEWWMQLCPEEELDDLRHSGKLMLLFSLLEECYAIGDKLLVFSQSLYTLDVIELFLKRIDEYTQRKNNASDDDEEVKKEGRTIGRLYRLFLISTRAGGLGINLVAANRVVIFDVSWNPSHDIQSIFRVYRFGQVKPCYIYRFIALGTMEEKIYERQVTKLAIAKRVIDEHQIDRHYKEHDLMELYKTDLVPDEPRKQPPLPKDRMFALQLQKFDKVIYKYHEHDSLLENKHEETLNEEEMKAAWEEFEAEKSRPVVTYNYNPTPRMSGMGPVTSNTIYGFRSDIMLNLLSMYARKQHPTANDTQIKQLVPLLLTQLHEKMNLGDTSMYADLVLLQNLQQGPAMAFQNMIGQMNSHPRRNEYIQSVLGRHESTTVSTDASAKSFNGIVQSTSTYNQCNKYIIKSSYRTRLISFLHLI